MKEGKMASDPADERYGSSDKLAREEKYPGGARGAGGPGGGVLLHAPAKFAFTATSLWLIFLSMFPAARSPNSSDLSQQRFQLRRL